MGYYTPTEPIQIISAQDGADANQVLVDLAGVDEGDELLYIWIGLVRTAAANWSIRLQLENPTSPGNYLSLAAQNNFGQILIQNSTTTPVTNWIVPGFENSTGHRMPFAHALVVTPTMRMLFDWGAGGGASDDAQVWGIFSKRMG